MPSRSTNPRTHTFGYPKHPRIEGAFAINGRQDRPPGTFVKNVADRDRMMLPEALLKAIVDVGCYAVGMGASGFDDLDL